LGCKILIQNFAALNYLKKEVKTNKALLTGPPFLNISTCSMIRWAALNFPSSEPLIATDTSLKFFFESLSELILI
jgi:hypothetical protein